MADQPIHVLHLARWYPHDDDPMLGLFVQNQVKAMAPEVRSTVLFVWPVTGLKEVERTVKESESLTEICIAYPKRGFGPANLLTLMKLLFKEAQEVHRVRPFQLVHAHVLTRVAVVANWVGKRFHVPYIISEHWSRYYPENPIFKGFWRLYFTSRMLHEAKALICVSGALRDAMQRWKLTHPLTRIVPNVVDTDAFGLAPTRQSGTVRWVNIGCFEDRSKNLSGLVRAAAELLKEESDFELVLVGEGPDKDYIEALVLELGLTSHVRFAGLLTPEEVAEELSQADYLVQTSHYETFSTVVVEAWACGVPVISTPVGVFADLGNDANGISINSFDISHIALALRQSIAQRGRFDREAMRAMAVEQFGKATVSKLIRQVYEEALAAWPALPGKV